MKTIYPLNPKKIVTCSINNEKVGYGIIMERAVTDHNETCTQKRKEAWYKKFKETTKNYNIKFKRSSKGELLKGPGRLKKEDGSNAGMDGANLILTNRGYLLIDIQQAYFTSPSKKS